LHITPNITSKLNKTEDINMYLKEYYRGYDRFFIKHFVDITKEYGSNINASKKYTPHVQKL